MALKNATSVQTGSSTPTPTASFISALQRLQEIGELVKAKKLGCAESVDETVQQITNFLRSQQDQMLTIQEVATLLRCSYGEARNRMLTGRIRSVKDGRWHRTRKDWVEEYLLAKMLQKPEPQIAEVRGKRPKVKLVGDFKKGGIAYEFLRSRPE